MINEEIQIHQKNKKVVFGVRQVYSLEVSRMEEAQPMHGLRQLEYKGTINGSRFKTEIGQVEEMIGEMQC